VLLLAESGGADHGLAVDDAVADACALGRRAGEESIGRDGASGLAAAR
jgi:hypothetical protein